MTGEWLDAFGALLLTVPPGLLAVAFTLVVPFLRGVIRDVALVAVPLVILVFLVWAPAPVGASFALWGGEGIRGMELNPYVSSPLGRMFATVFLLMLAVGNLFALRVAGKAELTAAQLYGGAAVGIALCGDFFSLFVFWELAAVGSAVIVFSGRSVAARAACMRYLYMHILSGIVMLTGIVGLMAHTGDISLRVLTVETWYAYAILLGALINVGAPPFSAWIADAYPEASPSGTVFLSAFTTKAAVFLLLTVFPGTFLLIPLGVFMVLYGIIYALLENDMRRILAYSIVNQVGFMVAGAGVGTELAINGVATHAFAHIIYKGLLMMSAGSVLFVTGLRRCSQLGGLYRSMPIAMLCGAIGGAAISAVPFTSGYIAKTVVLEAALESGMAWLWFLFVAAGAGVFLHAGIKFVWFVFFQKVPHKTVAQPPLTMHLAMAAFVVACLVPGIVPNLLYDMLPYAMHVAPYTPAHLVSQAQLLLAAAVAFFAFLPLMKRTETVSLDFDWFYRKPGLMLWRGITRTASYLAASGSATARLFTGIEGTIGGALKDVLTARTDTSVLLLMLALAVMLAVVLAL